jgi:hypothetical protein
MWHLVVYYMLYLYYIFDPIGRGTRPYIGWVISGNRVGWKGSCREGPSSILWYPPWHPLHSLPRLASASERYRAGRSPCGGDPPLQWLGLRLWDSAFGFWKERGRLKGVSGFAVSLRSFPAGLNNTFDLLYKG